MTSVLQACTFWLGERLFGLDIAMVQEVLRFQVMTPVPLSPTAIHGLINLRGQIVTAIDLRTCLRLPPREDDEDTMNVVVRTPDGIVALLVDEIGDVLELDEAGFEPPPETIDPEIRHLIHGVYKLEETLLLMLAPDHLLQNAGPRPDQGGRTR